MDDEVQNVKPKYDRYVVEAVAEALTLWRNDKKQDDINWSLLPHNVRCAYIEQAVAAIEAYEKARHCEPLLQTTVIYIARKIAASLGYDWDTLYENKRERTDDRGKRHDINTPYKSDFIAAAEDLSPWLKHQTQPPQIVLKSNWTKPQWRQYLAP
jgi:hypothetical protein